MKTHHNTEPRVQPLVMSHTPKGVWNRKVQLARGFVFPASRKDFMKKFLIVLLFISLVASGCNNSDKVTQLEKQNQELQAQVAKQQQASDFDLSTQCTKQAQIFFDYWETDPQAKSAVDFSNHYNTKLNKCFIKIIVTITASKDNTYSEYLFDAVEKKQYGSFTVGIPTYGKPIICEMLDKFCQTRDEYDSFVSGYMNN